MEQSLLTELKNALIAEKNQLEGELQHIAKKSGTQGDYETTFPENLGGHDEENATEVEQYADNLAVEASLETQLKDVLDALQKMDAGTYGIDENTGDAITIDRLKAYPAARANIIK